MKIIFYKYCKICSSNLWFRVKRKWIERVFYKSKKYRCLYCQVDFLLLRFKKNIRV